jgi:hypothetical protein
LAFLMPPDALWRKLRPYREHRARRGYPLSRLHARLAACASLHDLSSIAKAKRPAGQDRALLCCASKTPPRQGTRGAAPSVPNLA